MHSTLENTSVGHFTNLIWYDIAVFSVAKYLIQLMINIVKMLSSMQISHHNEARPRFQKSIGMKHHLIW